LFSSFVGFIFLLLGIFNMGPASKYIYETSVQVRGFYWEAAVRIIHQHPLLGVGFDGYGDWFNRARSAEAFKYNSGVVSDSAHNIPLDIGASGGITLLLAYLLSIFWFSDLHGYISSPMKNLMKFMSRYLQLGLHMKCSHF
jgi:O-antigen ligase